MSTLEQNQDTFQSTARAVEAARHFQLSSEQTFRLSSAQQSHRQFSGMGSQGLTVADYYQRQLSAAAQTIGPEFAASRKADIVIAEHSLRHGRNPREMAQVMADHSICAGGLPAQDRLRYGIEVSKEAIQKLTQEQNQRAERSKFQTQTAKQSAMSKMQQEVIYKKGLERER